jgi:hypothetical protein
MSRANTGTVAHGDGRGEAISTITATHRDGVPETKRISPWPSVHLPLGDGASKPRATP